LLDIVAADELPVAVDGQLAGDEDEAPGDEALGEVTVEGGIPAAGAECLPVEHLSQGRPSGSHEVRKVRDLLHITCLYRPSY
jgi:hypothetical protein